MDVGAQMLCVLSRCIFSPLEILGGWKFTHMDAVCVLSTQREGFSKIPCNTFQQRTSEFARTIQVGDKTRSGRRWLPVCIRCTVADNAVEIIGQHLQPSTSIWKRRWASQCGFCLPKKRRQLNRHYIAHCVTRLANKISRSVFAPVLHISRCMMVPGCLSLGDRAAPPATTGRRQKQRRLMRLPVHHTLHLGWFRVLGELLLLL